MHNALAITAELPTTVSLFHDRPYRVLHAEQFEGAVIAQIRDPAVRALLIPGTKGVIGGIDQFIDSTDILSHAAQCRKLRDFYS